MWDQGFEMERDEQIKKSSELFYETGFSIDKFVSVNRDLF